MERVQYPYKLTPEYPQPLISTTHNRATNSNCSEKFSFDLKNTFKIILNNFKVKFLPLQRGSHIHWVTSKFFILIILFLLQPRLHPLHKRPHQHDRRRAKSIFTVHYRVQFAATWRPCKSPSTTNNRTKSRRWRWKLSIGQHLRALSQTPRLPDRGNSP